MSSNQGELWLALNVLEGGRLSFWGEGTGPPRSCRLGTLKPAKIGIRLKTTQVNNAVRPQDEIDATDFRKPSGTSARSG